MTGKIVGAAAPARLAGLDGPDSLTLGVLLSTRGLTELVVLSVGAAAGLLTTTLYTVLVINAVLTTIATGPLLTLIARRSRRPTGPPGPAGLEHTSHERRRLVGGQVTDDGVNDLTGGRHR